MVKVRTRVIFWVWFVFFIYLFLTFDTNFGGPDQPIYFAYTASVVEDGDLNAVNHLDSNYPYYLPDGKIGVSSSYNLPDFHNHGGVILWVPFYLYAKLMFFLDGKLHLLGLTDFNIGKLVKCALSFSTITFVFIAMLLTFLLSRLSFSNFISILSVLFIFFGTPVVYFSLQEVGNANIIASLFMILSVWFLSQAVKMKKTHWFLYGIFFSICATVKIDLWFQTFFIVFIFTTLVFLKQINWNRGIYFCGGFILGFMLKIINDYIKYGSLHSGEFGLLNFKDCYLIEQLFSSYHGFFYTSPIFYICLAGIILTVFYLSRGNKTSSEQKSRDMFIFFLALYLIIKIVIISYRYAWGGGTPGARALVAEFPVFVLLYARVLYDCKNLVLRVLLIVTSVICVAWNFIVISEYMRGINLDYIVKAPGIGVRMQGFKYMAGVLFSVKDLGLKLKLCFPLLAAVGLITYFFINKLNIVDYIFWYKKTDYNTGILKVFSIFTIYSFLVYTVITGLNLANNKKNVERLKYLGFFKNKTEVLLPGEYEKMENMGSMIEMIAYFKEIGDFKRVEKIKKNLKKLYGEDG